MSTVTGTINSNSIQGYVRSLRRVSHLCAPGQHATLLMSPDFPYTVTPSDPVVLYENDILVLTGYVIKKERSRPSYDFVVEADDTYTRVVNYFIDTQELTTAGHDTAYWAAYILDLCGSTYNIYGTPAAIPAGIQIGLRPASESLKDVMAYASWYVWADKNGVLQLGQISRNLAGLTLNEFTKFQYNLGDETTRNVIKVFGLGSIFASASTTIPGIVPDRIAVVGSPLIATVAEAQRVADYMLGELGDTTKIIQGSIIGNPRVRIGNVITMTHVINGVRYSGTDTVTSLESNYDISTGYEMEVTIGERCPRIAGWSVVTPVLWAGLNGNGVYRSLDKGLTWGDYNAGLPGAAGSRVATRVAGNYYGQALALVNDTLYYETGDVWSPTTLPLPTGFGSYGTIKAIGALGGQDMFAVLTSNGARSWVYFSSTPTTGSFGENSGSTWGQPVAMSYDDPTTGSLTYSIVGFDLYSKVGSAMVIANTSIGTSGSATLGGISPVYLHNLQRISGDWVISDDLYDAFGDFHWGSLGGNNTFVGFQAANEWGTGFDQYYWAVWRLDSSGSLPNGHGRITYTVYTTQGDPSTGGVRPIDTGEFSTALDAFTPSFTQTQGDYTSYESYGCGSPAPPVTATIEFGGTGVFSSTMYVAFQITAPTHEVEPCGGDGQGNVGFNMSIDSIEWVGSSGSSWILYETSSGSTAFDLYSVSQAGAALVSNITPSSGSPSSRLFISEDGEAIVYDSPNRLYISQSLGGAFAQVFPTGATTTNISAATRVDASSGSPIPFYDTVIGGQTGGNSETFYQASVETAGGWTDTSGSFPAGFAVTDMIWSTTATQGIIAGSNGSNNTKIVRIDPLTAPYTTVTVSDSGIPQESASGVLDLEFSA